MHYYGIYFWRDIVKNILCYGNSNVRGVIPEKVRGTLVKVYDKNKRWTGILQKLLGDDYNVIEEGMGGRTTQFDEINPGRPYRNGLKDLPLFLEAHYPIDLIIFFLGINDTKTQYNANADDIAKGMQQLIQCIQNSKKGRNEKAPAVLLVSPIPIQRIPDLPSEFDKTSIAKSALLTILYKNLADEMHCDFLNTSENIKASQNDGLHLDESEHVVLANSIYKKILMLFK